MKLLAFILFPMLAFAQYTIPGATGANAGSGGGQTPAAFVNSNATFTASNTPSSLTLSETAGNLIVCYGSVHAGGGTPTLSITGNVNSYTSIITPINSFTIFYAAAYATIAASTTTETISNNLTGGTGISDNEIGCQQWSGSQATVGAAIGAHCSNADNTGTVLTTIPCSSTLTIVAGDGASQFINTNFQTTFTWTPANSFTLDVCFGSTTSCSVSNVGALAYGTNIPSTITPSFDVSTGIHYYLMMAFSIKGH